MKLRDWIFIPILTAIVRLIYVKMAFGITSVSEEGLFVALDTVISVILGMAFYRLTLLGSKKVGGEE